MIEAHPLSRPRQTSRGFSLIEVLVALAVFGMAATYLMSTFVNALLARERSVQNDLLKDDIQTVRLQLLLEPDREAAEDGGDFPTLNHGEARWEARIEPTDLIDLFAVQFSVAFPDSPDGQPVDYEEQLYLLRPTWSEGDERSELLEDKRDALLDERRFDHF